jgi:hypothetical protein
MSFRKFKFDTCVDPGSIFSEKYDSLYIIRFPWEQLVFFVIFQVVKQAISMPIRNTGL